MPEGNTLPRVFHNNPVRGSSEGELPLIFCLAGKFFSCARKKLFGVGEKQKKTDCNFVRLCGIMQRKTGKGEGVRCFLR